MLNIITHLQKSIIRIYLLFSFILILDYSIVFAGMNSDNSLFMLQSNQIIGMIPDINNAYGVAFRDFNNDDHPDIYFTCFRNLNRLLINNGGIIPFVDRTILSGTGGYLMVTGNTNLELGANVADYNNDGLQDVVTIGWGRTTVINKQLKGFDFKDVTGDVGVDHPITNVKRYWAKIIEL